MLNILSKPPEVLTINGQAYPINTDFKVWIKVYDIFENIEEENVMASIAEISDLIFLIPPPPELTPEILPAVNTFLKGYPTAENKNSTTDNRDRVISFEHDINNIVTAIKHQSGVDFTTGETFHWWSFLLELQNISETSLIAKIMGYRGYKGKDRDMIKLRHHYIIPPTRKQQAVADKAYDEFYGA